MTKILVIEDSIDLRDDLIELLGLNEGYVTEGAENGVIGLTKAKEFKPDLILCDIMMPEMDGYNVLRHLRADPETAGIAFIFLTAKTERVDRQEGMILGADDYIEKPYDVSYLLDSIRVQLEKRARANAAVQQKVQQMQATIITALPHELRTPLNTIIGFSEMLQSEAQYLKPDQIASWSAHIHSAGHRLFHLVENYLYYVRLQVSIQQNHQPEVREAINDFDLIVKQQADTIAKKYKREEDLHLEMESCPQLPIEHPDGLKIIEELIDNAFKFSTKGTKVEVCGNIEGNHYAFTVTDKGRGMSKEQIDSIGGFVQFERWLHEQQGMGLGLIVVKHLAELYRLNMEIESALDAGTSVKLKLPTS